MDLDVIRSCRLHVGSYQAVVSGSGEAPYTAALTASLGVEHAHMFETVTSVAFSLLLPDEPHTTANRTAAITPIPIGAMNVRSSLMLLQHVFQIRADVPA